MKPKNIGITVLDVFHQAAYEGVPSHWCVQYKNEGSPFVSYEYFDTHTEAREWAMDYGYED